MGVVEWEGGRVSTHDSVAVARAISGARLRDAYRQAVSVITLGLATVRDNSVVVGPVTLLRFGPPKVTRNAVDWPIEGGVLAGAPGGHWRVRASAGRVEAAVTGYTPRLPRWIYTFSHLQVHELFTRVYLLRLRGSQPTSGVRHPSAEDRFRAATVDLALCLTVARRPSRLIAFAAAYHVVCWSLWGRTLGGLVTGQRVVALDGSKLTPAQSLLRLAVLPMSWFTGRPVQDEVSASDVIAG